VKLAYKAFDRAGRAVADTIEATDPAEAAETLRRRGLYVTDLRPGTAPAAGPDRRTRPSGRRLKSLAVFTGQLQVLTSCGTPLVEALGALARQTSDARLRSVVADVQRRVEEGAALSAALEVHRETFGPVYRSLVAAGEASGDLSAMLGRLAETLRKQVRIRNALLGALIYPALLSVVAVGVLGLMFTVVIPRFGELFETLEVPLPPTTSALLAVSQALTGYWYVAALAVGAPALGLTAWLLSAPGRRTFQSAVLRLPQVGRIVRGFITARIVRLLGLLLEANVPILEALDLARRSIVNHRYDDLLAKTQDAVTRGEAISDVWGQSDLVSPSVQEIVRNGERSGQVARMLLSAADFLDDENELIVRSLTSILEPVILVGMGLVVGLVAVSMFTPLFDLTAMTQGGAP